jgi:hypothetical protein|tara:strand:+ start:538 stop:999 length:462 start_codon:yes stop_codon:yes gene_type:complete
MELKKIIIIFFFINFLSHLNAEMTEPSKDILPYDVVKIQLDALKKNNQSERDLGIKQVWLFAHPENKKITGPYERFKAMIYGEQYKILLNHSSHKINLIMNSKDKYIYRVEILTKNKQLFFYEWHVKKGSEVNCKKCWFTSSVSIPIDQGNTI